jgi:hypothetical protein
MWEVLNAYVIMHIMIVKDVMVASLTNGGNFGGIG